MAPSKRTVSPLMYPLRTISSAMLANSGEWPNRGGNGTIEPNASSICGVARDIAGVLKIPGVAGPANPQVDRRLQGRLNVGACVRSPSYDRADIHPRCSVTRIVVDVEANQVLIVLLDNQPVELSPIDQG